jgi:hypothetical protein
VYHWPETFCIAAIEAQAAGCPVLTSAVGALPETVGDGGLCLHGDPRSPAYQDAFVNAAVQLLRDDQQWSALSQRARERTDPFYSWTTIAAEWDTLISGGLANESPEADRVARHISGRRFALAANMIGRLPCPDGTDAAAWQDLIDLSSRLAAAAEIPADLAARVTLAFGALRRTCALEHALPVCADVSRTDTRAHTTDRDTVAQDSHAG